MYIGTATGVVSVAAVRRKTEPELGMWDTLNAVSGAPWKKTPGAFSGKVVKFQRQGIPLREAVVSSHCQCSQQFSVYAMSVSVQVWDSINMGRL